jgi:hypothetical protein
MARLVLAIIAGFFCWVILWFVSEQIISALWPAFGAHQTAFQSSIENGGVFTPNPTFLLIHIVLASIVSLVTGLITALVAGENRRAPLIVAILLLMMGLAKAGMSWSLVPIWYHLIFTAVLVPMTIIGGRMKKTAQRNF